jgi:hypothetical protein
LLVAVAFKGTKLGTAIGNEELKMSNEQLERENPPDNTYYTD